MKRLVTLLLFLMLLVAGMTLVACEEGEQATPVTTVTATPKASPTLTVSPTAAITAMPEEIPTPETTPRLTTGRVQAMASRVIDGDTIEIEGGLRVRYIGHRHAGDGTP